MQCHKAEITMVSESGGPLLSKNNSKSPSMGTGLSSMCKAVGPALLPNLGRMSLAPGVQGMRLCGMRPAKLGTTAVALAFLIPDHEPHNSQAFCPKRRRSLDVEKGQQRAQRGCETGGGGEEGARRWPGRRGQKTRPWVSQWDPGSSIRP